MGRRLSNKKAFSSSPSTSVWFLIPAEMLISYAEGDILGEATGTLVAPAGECLLMVIQPCGCVTPLPCPSVFGSSCCPIPWEGSVTQSLEESQCPAYSSVHTGHCAILICLLCGQRYRSSRWQGSAASTVPGPVSCTHPCYQMLEVSRALLR